MVKPAEMGRVLPTIVQGRIDFSGGPWRCWKWLGKINRGGYGLVYDPANQGVGLAHRLVYETCFPGKLGALPLDHLCEVKLCVNPLHLEPVTLAENSRRYYRQLEYACSRGHVRSVYGRTDRRGRMNCDACVKIRNDSRTWHTHAASAAGAPLCSTEAGPRFALAADGVPASCKRCAAIQNGTMVLQLDAATKAPKKGNRK